MIEFLCWILNASKDIHGFVLDDSKGAMFDNLREEFHEIKLKERDGQQRLTFVHEDGVLDKLLKYTQSCFMEPNRALFLVPRLFHEAGLLVQKWKKN